MPGGDGPPVRGSFLPPVGLLLRMFAEVVFHGPLRVGGTVRRQSTVESVTEKSGRSGRLVGRGTADGFALDLTGPVGATTVPHATLTATAR
ncbi:hypothetical protein [Nonomuraea sp. NPDC049758]|uniref:hypothetical protein n=1 Tax=Nonomuraea sp. NPDC049758 TaxID=3154360 RepID=UPI003444DEAC